MELSRHGLTWDEPVPKDLGVSTKVFEESSNNRPKRLQGLIQQEKEDYSGPPSSKAVSCILAKVTSSQGVQFMATNHFTFKEYQGIHSSLEDGNMYPFEPSTEVLKYLLCIIAEA